MSVPDLPKIDPRPRLECGGPAVAVRDHAAENGADVTGIADSDGVRPACGGRGFPGLREIAPRVAASPEDSRWPAIAAHGDVPAAGAIQSGIFPWPDFSSKRCLIARSRDASRPPAEAFGRKKESRALDGTAMDARFRDAGTRGRIVERLEAA